MQRFKKILMVSSLFPQLSEVDRLSFRQLSMLQVLRLSNNRIIDLAKVAFHGLTGLQVILGQMVLLFPHKKK